MYNFLIRSNTKVRFAYIAADLLLAAGAFYISYFVRFNILDRPVLGFNFPYAREYASIFILWLIFVLTFFARANLYYTNRSLTIPKELSIVCINVFYSSILILAAAFFAKYKFFSRFIFFSSFGMLCFFLGGWRAIKRVIVRKMIQKGFRNINVLIVGAGKTGRLVREEIKSNPWLGFKVIGFLDDKKNGSYESLPIFGKLEDFFSMVKKYFIDEVIITIPSERNAIAKLIREAKKLRVGVSIVPESFDEPLPAINIDYLGSIPLVTYKERKLHPAEIALKYIFDFIFALLALILLSPLFFICAVLIKLDSNGPVFYIQKRVGAKGRVFSLYKFRSMVKNADKLKEKLEEKNEVKDGIIFKIKNDPRVTRFGSFLRKSSFDELPQLFNVIKGDMGLVGPRPPTPDEVEKYHYNHMQRLSIRPGITGLSQVRGRSELTFRKWVKWDIWYLNNWSFGLDLMILLWTVPVVLKRKGAY